MEQDAVMVETGYSCMVRQEGAKHMDGTTVSPAIISTITLKVASL
jgi:hypothetical protein